MTFDLERARGLRDFLQDDCAEVGDVWAEMIAEIERLRGFKIAARDLNNDLIRIAGERDELAARIQELEDALVEERVIGEGGFRAEQCEFWYIEDLPEESCMELDGPCDWAKCPRKHELCDVAYQQLAEEGKIGPDDSKKISHLRPYEVVAADLAGMLAKSWQITDERKAAIQWAEEMAGDCKAGDVLRGMLAEVTR